MAKTTWFRPGTIADLVTYLWGHRSVQGKRFLCPFHGDTHPSANIYTDGDGHERYCCFSCDAKGDVLDILQKYHELNPTDPRLNGIDIKSFSDRVRAVADFTKAPIEFDLTVGAGGGRRNDLLVKTAFWGVCRDFFRTAPDAELDDIRFYLASRCIPTHLQHRFDIGVIPPVPALVAGLSAISANVSAVMDALRSDGDGDRLTKLRSIPGNSDRSDADLFFSEYRGWLVFPYRTDINSVNAFKVRGITKQDFEKYSNGASAPAWMASYPAKPAPGGKTKSIKRMRTFGKFEGMYGLTPEFIKKDDGQVLIFEGEFDLLAFQAQALAEKIKVTAAPETLDRMVGAGAIRQAQDLVAATEDDSPPRGLCAGGTSMTVSDRVIETLANFKAYLYAFFFDNDEAGHKACIEVCKRGMSRALPASIVFMKGLYESFGVKDVADLVLAARAKTPRPYHEILVPYAAAHNLKAGDYFAELFRMESAAPTPDGRRQTLNEKRALAFSYSLRFGISSFELDDFSKAIQDVTSIEPHEFRQRCLGSVPLTFERANKYRLEYRNDGRLWRDQWSDRNQEWAESWSHIANFHFQIVEYQDADFDYRKSRQVIRVRHPKGSYFLNMQRQVIRKLENIYEASMAAGEHFEFSTEAGMTNQVAMDIHEMNEAYGFVARTKKLVASVGYHSFGGQKYWVMPSLTVGPDGVVARNSDIAIDRPGSDPFVSDADGQAISGMAGQDDPGRQGQMEKMLRQYDIRRVATDEDCRVLVTMLADSFFEMHHDACLVGWGHIFSAPMYAWPAGFRRHVLMLVGGSGGGKTTIAKCFQAFFMHMEPETKPVDVTHWSFSSTPAATEIAGEKAKDVIMVMDDFKAEIQKEEVYINIIQNYYDGTGRARANREGGAGASHIMRCQLIMTGEESFDKASATDRMLVVNVNRGSDDIKKIVEANGGVDLAKQVVFPKLYLAGPFMLRYISWLHRNKPVIQWAINHFSQVGGDRMSGFTTQNRIGVELFMRFVNDEGRRYGWLTESVAAKLDGYAREHEILVERMLKKARLVMQSKLQTYRIAGYLFNSIGQTVFLAPSAEEFVQYLHTDSLVQKVKLNGFTTDRLRSHNPDLSFRLNGHSLAYILKEDFTAIVIKDLKFEKEGSALEQMKEKGWLVFYQVGNPERGTKVRLNEKDSRYFHIFDMTALEAGIDTEEAFGLLDPLPLPVITKGPLKATAVAAPAQVQDDFQQKLP